MKRILFALLLVLVLAGTADAQVLFSTNFEVFNGGAYGFFAISGSKLTGATITNLPTDGWNGSQGARIFAPGGVGCTTATCQGNVGWSTGSLGAHVWTLGDSMFLRFRFRLDGQWPWAGIKFIIVPGPTSGQRVIVQLESPFDSGSGCQPSGEGNDYYGGAVVADPTPPPVVWTRATQFSLANPWITLAGGVAHSPSNYAVMQPHINISHDCAPFVVFPYRTNVADIKPQAVGAASQTGWVHYQLEIISGAAGNAGFKVWANNNTYSAPTAQALNMTVGGGNISVANWNDSIEFGGFAGIGDTGSATFSVDDFEVSTAFDPNWYVALGGGGSGPYRFRFKP